MIEWIKRLFKKNCINRMGLDWASIKANGMPKSPTDYFVCDMDSKRSPFVGIAHTWSKSVGFYDENERQINVTHWAEINLPEAAPPQKGQDNE